MCSVTALARHPWAGHVSARLDVEVIPRGERAWRHETYHWSLRPLWHTAGALVFIAVYKS